jgi:hypothetical protein
MSRPISTKAFLVLLWATSCVVFCPAQDKKAQAQSRPDFTGTWVRSLSKSKNNRWPLGTALVTLTILHHEPEIKITRKSDLRGKETIIEGLYYTDGRGENNSARFQGVVSLGVPGQTGEMRPRPARGSDTRSKTKWEANKLVSRWTFTTEVLGNWVDMDVTEKRELSADGKTLTITTSFGRPALTEVFDRVQ